MGANLTRKQSEALSLRLQGYTADRASDILGVSDGAVVQRRWARGLARLTKEQRDNFFTALRKVVCERQHVRPAQLSGYSNI